MSLDQRRKSRATRLVAVDSSAVSARIARDILHDVNNALMGVLGCAKAALGELDASAAARPYVEEIHKAAAQATAATRQSLSFGRHAVSGPADVLLNELVLGGADLLARMAGHSVGLTIHLEPDLGPVRADPVVLEHALMHAVLRARDRLRQGGEVTIATRAAGSQNCVLSISASGPGFEPDAALLEDGVLIAVVGAAGGALNGAELAGCGSIEIVLPVARSLDTPAPKNAHGPIVRPTHDCGTVLVAEDEIGALSLIRGILEAGGFSVLDAACGRDALAACGDAGRPLDLLLCDIHLPDMMGGQLFDALRSKRPDLAVLFMSGYTACEAISSGWVNADQSFLAKPFDSDGLLRKIHQVLDAR